MRIRATGPLAASYPAAVVLVILALTPYLMLTTATQPLERLIGDDLGMSRAALQLTAAMANAAYAAGTVIAVQLASRLPPRRLLVLYAAAFVVGSVLAAWAPLPGLFVAGRVLQGLTTGLMLIAAVPPLVLSWGPDKLPRTAVIMNIGIFGAVALGPVIGGSSAGTGTWAPLLWIVTAFGVGTLAMALLTFEDAEPQDPEAPVDIVAVVLAVGACGAAFFGIAQLVDNTATAVVVLLPLIAGVAAVVALVAHEGLVERPLIPVRQLAHTVPVAAIIIAMTAGAASVALVELVQVALRARGVSPTHAGMLFWPEIGAALLAAALFGMLLRTRWVPVLTAVGTGVLAGAAVVLTGTVSGGDALVLVGAGLVGFGVGASVSPALFLTGFSLRSPQLPRVFAFIELLRAVAAFLVAPVVVQIAQTAGVRTGIWIAGGIALLGLVAAVAVWLAGGVRLRAPDIPPWMAGERPAIPSSRVGTAAREARRRRRGRAYVR